MSDAITTHSAQALARLVYQFEDATNLQSLISVLAARVQGVEDELDNLILLRWISTAEGTQLDEIGLIVGQLRNGYNDYEYSVVLLVKIYLNGSHGEPEVLIAAVRTITLASIVTLIEGSVATVIITGNGLLAPICIGAKLSGLAPAGVRLCFISTYGVEFPFAFAYDGTGYPDPPIGLGFSESDGIGGILTEQGQIAEEFE